MMEECSHVSLSLLLVIGLACLCDTRQVATCSPPAEIENAELQQQFRNKDAFSEGDVLAYDCKPGYSISGRSRERTCTIAGMWTDVNFRCDAIRCPYIPDPEHGRRIDGNNEAGLSTHFSCYLGYRLVGPSMLTCRVDGDWTPSGRPSCDPVLCPELGYLKNGDIFQDDGGGVRNGYQSVAKYTCDYDYSINGTTSRSVDRLCQSDGTWSGYDYFCEVPKCLPIELNKGTVSYVLGAEPRAHGSYAMFQCRKSYCLFPDSFKSKCVRDRLEWDPSPPKCYKTLEVTCPENTDCDKGSLCQNETLRITCHRGYELYNKNFLDQRQMTISNDNGAAISVNRNERLTTLPICLEERCTVIENMNTRFTIITRQREPRLPLNTGSTVSSNTLIEYACKDPNNYELLVDINAEKTYPSSFVAECYRGEFRQNSRGLSEEDFPMCQEKRCRVPGLSSFRETHFGIRGEVINGHVESSRKVTITCETGYHMEHTYTDDRVWSQRKNTVELTCEHGVWTGVFPEKCHPDLRSTEGNTPGPATAMPHFTVEDGSQAQENLESCHISIHEGNIYYTFENGTRKNITTEGLIDNGTIVFVECVDGFDLKTKLGDWTNISVATVECDHGNWKNVHFCKEGLSVPSTSVKQEDGSGKIAPREEESCQISVHEGNTHEYYIYKNDKREEITKGGPIDHGTTVFLKCFDGFELQTLSEEWATISVAPVICDLGKWKNVHNCAERPSMPSLSSERQSCQIGMHEGNIYFTYENDIRRNITVGGPINHGTTVFVTCSDDFHLQTLSDEWATISVAPVTCDLGKWKNVHKCVKSCDLPRNSSFLYEDSRGRVVTEDTKVSDGTTITVTCLLDNYDYYQDTASLTCSGGHFGHINLDCP